MRVPWLLFFFFSFFLFVQHQPQNVLLCFSSFFRVAAAAARASGKNVQFLFSCFVNLLLAFGQIAFPFACDVWQFVVVFSPMLLSLIDKKVLFSATSPGGLSSLYHTKFHRPILRKREKETKYIHNNHHCTRLILKFIICKQKVATVITINISLLLRWILFFSCPFTCSQMRNLC